MKHRILAAAAVAMLAACSTTQVTQSQAKEVPQDRVYAPEYLLETSEKSAQVVFLRDAGFSGSGCSHDLFVNNVKVAAIRHAEGITVHLQPGDYFFRLETGGGLCPNISTSQNASLAAGARQVYRILLPSDGSLRLTRTE